LVSNSINNRDSKIFDSKSKINDRRLISRYGEYIGADDTRKGLLKKTDELRGIREKYTLMSFVGDRMIAGQ